MEERERKKKELQERKDAVKREYLLAVSTGGNGMDLSMLHTARSLREVVDKEEVAALLHGLVWIALHRIIHDYA